MDFTTETDRKLIDAEIYSGDSDDSFIAMKSFLQVKEAIQSLGRSVKELQSQYFKYETDSSATQRATIDEIEIVPVTPFTEDDLDCGLTTLLITFALFLFAMFICFKIAFCYRAQSDKKKMQAALANKEAADMKSDYDIKIV